MTPQEKLYMAALVNNADEVAALLAAGADPNKPNAAGNTAMHAACLYNTSDCTEEIVRLLRDAGGDINAFNLAGESPLLLLLKNASSLPGSGSSYYKYQQPSVGDAVNKEYQLALWLVEQEGVDPNCGHAVISQLPNLMFDFSKQRGADKHEALVAELFGAMVCGLVGASWRIDRTDDLGQTLLHKVCRCYTPQLKDTLAMLLEAGADPSATDHHGRTPVHELIASGGLSQTTGLALLVKHGGDIRRADAQGRTPLHYALMRKDHGKQSFQNANASILRWLVRKGADTNAPDCYGVTPLQIMASGVAAGSNSNKDINLLGEIVARASAHAETEPLEPTPLQRFYQARWNKQEDQARDIIADMSPNAADTSGHTLLWSAIDNGWYDCAADLLKAGADPNLRPSAGPNAGWTPLHVAARHGNERCLDLLLSYGADVHATTISAPSAGWNYNAGRFLSPLHAASAHKPCFIRLLQAGANPNILDNQDRIRLCKGWMDVGPSGPISPDSCVGALVKAGMDFNLMDGRGNTLLQYSCTKLDKMTRLVGLGGAINQADKDGNTPLAASVSRLGYSPYNHYTAHLAAYQACGADVNCVNQEGLTPLMLVVADRPGHAPVLAQALIDLGADPALGRCTVERLYRASRYENMDQSLSSDARRRLLAVLFEGGLVPDAALDKDGTSLMHQLCRRQIPADDLAIVLQYCADINCTNQAGETPFMVLLKEAPSLSLAAIKMVVNAGADVNVRGHEGRLPLDVLLNRGLLQGDDLERARQLLLEAGAMSDRDTVPLQPSSEKANALTARP